MYTYGIVKDTLTHGGHEVLRKSSAGQQFMQLSQVKLLSFYLNSLLCACPVSSLGGRPDGTIPAAVVPVLPPSV